MDRFLDEQENPSPHRDRSSSPNIHSLIAGDHKRQHHARTPPSSNPASDEQHQQVGQLPHKSVDPNSVATTGIQGSAISLLLPSNINELTSVATCTFSSEQSTHNLKAVRNQVEDLTNNLTSSFNHQNLESLVKITSRDDFALPAETSNRKARAINNNNNNNNIGNEFNHHQSPLKNFEVTLSGVATSAATGGLVTLSADSIVPSTPTM